MGQRREAKNRMRWGGLCRKRQGWKEISLILKTMKVKIQSQTLKRQHEIQTDLNKLFPVTQLDYRIAYQKG